MLKKTLLSLLILVSVTLTESKGFFTKEFRTSEHGKTFIKEREGYSEIAYFDGTWTIGYGNTFYPDGRAVRKGDRITTEQGTQILDFVLQTTFEPVVNQEVTSEINQSQFDALISYAYNRGNQRFKNSVLLQMVNQDPANKAISAQFVKEWGTNQKFKNGLIRRRKQEAELYFSQVEFKETENELNRKPKPKYMFLVWILTGVSLTFLGQYLAKHFDFSLKIRKRP